MATPRPRRRLGWIGWLLVGIGCLTLMAVAYVLWLLSDHDLDRLRADMRADGIPTSWPEVGLVSAPEPRQADWRRLLSLSQAVKTYRSTMDANYTWPGPRPGVAVPAEVHRYYAGLDHSDIDELDAILSRIGSDAINTHVESKADDTRPELNPLRQLAQLMRERVAIAAPGEVAGLLSRSSQLVPIREPPSLMSDLLSISFAGIWCGSVAARLPDLPAGDRAAVARMCLDMDALLERQAITCARGELIIMMEYAHRLVRLPNAQLVMTLNFATPLGVGSSGGDWIPDWVRAEWFRACTRASRGAWLSMAVERIRYLASHAAASDRMAYYRLLESRIEGMRQSPMYRDIGDILGAIAMMDRQSADMRMRLRLLAAELEQRPWPPDPYDPSGHAYRRVERDGKLIGAYSVGLNGVDDAGKGDDRCIDLYGDCRAPKP